MLFRSSSAVEASAPEPAAATAPEAAPPSLDAPVPADAVDAGPVVVTAAGQLRTVETWALLSEPDREWTRRQVGERNVQRLAHLHRVGGRFCFGSAGT